MNFDGDDNFLKEEELDDNDMMLFAEGEDEAPQPIKSELSQSDSALMPPPPPTPLRASAATVQAPVSRKTASQDATARRLRVNDVFVAPTAPVLAGVQSPLNGEPRSEPLPAHTLEHYEIAKRLAAEQSVDEFGNSSVGGGAVSKIGDSAAQVNHFLAVISEARSRTDPTVLTQLPYATKTNGAQLGRAFYMQGLTVAPHASRPVSENTEQQRKLASAARLVRRAHIEAMTRSAKLREFRCANGTGCVVYKFRDSYNAPLSKCDDTEPLVAFLYEDEFARAQVDRKSMAALWERRACVQCMICAANRVVTNLRFRNQALDAHNYLVVPFYVEVDVAGEYPVGATLGPGKGVFEGLVFNLPRYTELDWVAARHADGGEEVVHYSNVGVPAFPVPRETIEAHSRSGFSVAL